MKRFKSPLRRYASEVRQWLSVRRVAQVGTILTFGSVGVYLLLSSSAATPTTNIEAEAGTASSTQLQVSDSSASGGAAIRFGGVPIRNIDDKGVGISANLAALNSSDRAAELADLKSLGITWVRMDIAWKNLQPNQGDPYNWSVYDSTIADAASYGIKVDGIIDYATTWNRVSGCDTTTNCQPADLDAYATFARAVVQHYGNKLGAVELWNEPDIVQFWQPRPNDSVYISMLEKAYTAIKSVDPGMLVISAGLSPSGNNPSNGNIDAVTFVSDMYTQGAKNYFDAVGYHPYSYPHLPSQSTTTPTGWSKLAQAAPDNIRSLMIANGDAAKHVWLTEVGAPTGGPNNLTTCAQANANTYPSNSDHVDQCLQAQILSEAITKAKSYDWAGVTFIYTYKDGGTSTSTKENFFGLLDYNGNRKTSYDAVKQAIAQ